jgi:diacylglycerol O-acyltransferase / wax synthase
MATPDAAPGRTPRDLLGDRRMSDLEALLWNVDKDPYLSSNFGSVTLLDRPPDLERFRRRMLVATSNIPRLHQRVVPALGRMAPPEWCDAADFDIRDHVRHQALPTPGSLAQLLDLAARFVQDPLDRSRPLWEFVLVDGLPDGGAALIQKMHHTITDGEGGIRLSEQFIDLIRDAPLDEEVEIRTGPSGGGSLWGSTSDTLAHGWRRGIGIAHRAVGVGASTVRHPERALTLGSGAIEAGQSVARQLTVTDPHRSPLWNEPTLGRGLEILDIPLDEVRRAAKELGGSINDLFVAAAAAGAGRYHRALGAETEELRMAMPVSTRQGRSAGGNSFVPTRVLVPTGELDPVTRFERVHEALSRTKAEPAIGLVAGLAGVANLLPTSVLVRVARQQAETVDFATSNLRAAPFDLFIAGGRVEGTYPIGPLAGSAFNLTLMSYRGVLNLGLHVDTGMISDPVRLRAEIEASFEELITAGS